MKDRDSRYATTPGFHDGGFPGFRPRSIEPTPGVIEHTIASHDRLDKLATHYYRDSRKWWLILDANPEISFGGDLDMGRLEGRTIVIPADRGRRRGG